MTEPLGFFNSYSNSLFFGFSAGYGLRREDGKIKVLDFSPPVANYQDNLKSGVKEDLKGFSRLSIIPATSFVIGNLSSPEAEGTGIYLHEGGLGLGLSYAYFTGNRLALGLQYGISLFTSTDFEPESGSGGENLGRYQILHDIEPFAEYHLGWFYLRFGAAYKRMLASFYDIENSPLYDEYWDTETGISSAYLNSFVLRPGVGFTFNRDKRLNFSLSVIPEIQFVSFADDPSLNWITMGGSIGVGMSYRFK